MVPLGGNAWTAQSSDFDQYLVIDLGQVRNITEIATQGRPFSSEYVMEYAISYGTNGLDYADYKEPGGNTKSPHTGAEATSSHLIAYKDITSSIELYQNLTQPEEEALLLAALMDKEEQFALKALCLALWFLHICLTLSLTTSSCSLLFLVSSISLVAGQLAWTPEESTYYHFLTINLDGPKQIHSIATQGREGTAEYVTEYIVQYSNDGEGWLSYTSALGEPEMFKGNINGDSIRKNSFEVPIIAQWLRINPTRWRDRISLRVELYGCDYVADNLYFNGTALVRWDLMRDPISATRESIRFRLKTTAANGVLIYSRGTQGDYVALQLRDNRLLLNIDLGAGIMTSLSVGSLLDDNIWHDVVISRNRRDIVFSVDRVVIRGRVKGEFYRLNLNRGFYIGGVPNKQDGLIVTQNFTGCMENLYLNSTNIIRTIKEANSYENYFVYEKVNTIYSCPVSIALKFLVENGGRKNHPQFSRVRFKPRSPIRSSLAQHKTSVVANYATEEYCCKNEVVFDSCLMIDRCNPNPCKHSGICKQNSYEFLCDCSNTGYTGDVCHSSDGRIVTVIRHSNEQTTQVDGFQEPGSFVQNIMYEADMEQMEALVNRSNSCWQRLQYACKHSRLFNSPSDEQNFRPFSWWVSRYNQKMDFWSGSLPGSRKCECGVMGTCSDPTKWCNCDSELEGWLEDGGDITQKEFLPVKQLRFGDTGSALDEKEGRYTLGPLMCEGDGGYQLQFQYQAGSGPLGVSVDTAYKMSDNNWHSVSVERNRKGARIVVDGAQKSEIREPPGPVRALHLTSQLVVGATIDYRDGFVGCIRALLLNGRLIDLRQHADRGQYGLSPGCVGKCESNPCLNNGTCQERYDGYHCDCRWTAFKGPICADEIGVNMRLSSMIRYDFSGSWRSTISENIRVGFTTTNPKGFLLGFSSNITGEYLTIMVSNSGHLRVVFDFGFERQEVIFPGKHFGLGQYHDVRIRRKNSGSVLVMEVDNYESQEFTFNIKASADAQFNNIQYMYIGRNESMTEGFIGCVSRVEFDDIYPLKLLFQEDGPSNVKSLGTPLNEDFCGVEPVTHPPNMVETRPPPLVDEAKLRQIYNRTDSAILGGVLAVIFLALLIMAILIGRYLARHKGEYLTQEDKGADSAMDPDSAVVRSATGHQVQKKKEWFI
uniref:Neurexin-4 n=1 Tax=Timema genevievae TaxID=629358 RepID=A0A7R9JS34_TIMGE|nr:unnamed protein product [Timema genevievae]